MNAQTIERMLRSRPITKGRYGGVYPIDMLPELHTFPKYIIINTSTSDIRVGHWTLLYFKTATEAYFFDSYGRNHTHVTNGHLLEIYLAGVHVLNCKYILQSRQSMVCGYYCLYVAYSFCKGLTFSNMFRMFYKYVDYNDELIVKLVNDIYTKHKV